MTKTSADSDLTVILGGDVMLGRGIDQMLGHPGEPELHEAYLYDARGYLEIAEAANGTIPYPVQDTWPWGEALVELHRLREAAVVMNLETTVTQRDDFAPGKPVHYRMNPENLGCLLAVHPDVCVLANNHILDFGRLGLVDSLTALHGAGLKTVGAGRTREQARAPAEVPLTGGGRLVVFAFGHESSGVARAWAATNDSPGVAQLPDLTDATAEQVGASVAAAKADGAVVIVSLHWGSNWGYAVPEERVHFAHRLVDAGTDIVHGHSSHHPRPIEVYGERLILYGCGDLINDYEGIRGYGEYRQDLRLLYRASLERHTGRAEGAVAMNAAQPSAGHRTLPAPPTHGSRHGRHPEVCIARR
ncbi:MAG: CapA family protein [Intrasporangiaceae bacterium]|nr:CapA family protein [Intrasporangiaceae bacterium]